VRTFFENSKSQVKYRVANETGFDVRVAKYDALINTSPIDTLVRSTGICPELSIEHNQVFIVGVGLELPMPTFCEKFTWLYFPDPEVPFYRVTFLSRYGEMTPDNGKYWSVMCECARQPDDEVGGVGGWNSSMTSRYSR